uniref:General transcription factor IIH subunit 4 n=1 Tax=Lygus hesperus TaxID=30085 RepID=A0A0A9WM30_LYGHE
MVCYRVTRGSFASALRKGVTATQILKFLSLRAHPSMFRQYGSPTLHALSTTTTAHNISNSSNSSNIGNGRSNGNVTSAYSKPHTNNATTQADTFVIPRSFCDQLFM